MLYLCYFIIWFVLMEMISLIIVAGLGLSIALNLALKYFDIPAIIGYIVTGVLIVYLFDIRGNEILTDVAEFGIVFLMFMIGLEFSFDRLKSMRQEVLTFGILQVCITTCAFLLVNYYVLGFSFVFSLVVSMGFSLSSTTIVLSHYEANKQLDTSFGKNAVGILIMQDIAVIPILLILAIMTDSQASLGDMLIKTFISGVLVLALLLIPGRWLAVRMLSRAARAKTNELFMVSVLFLVLGSALLAHAFGFSMSLGAFIAGMSISKTRFRYQVQSDLSHFKDIFLGLFFVTVGMQIDVGFLFQEFFALMLALALVMVFKTAVVYWILRWFRSYTSALKTALSLCQIGEFSFAIFLMANRENIFAERVSGGLFGALEDAGIISFGDWDIYQFFVLMVTFSMIATPFILKYLDPICAFVLKQKIRQSHPSDELTKIPSDLQSGHIIVVGYGEFGIEVVDLLKQAGKTYVAVDSDGERVELGLKLKDRVVYGNIKQVEFLKLLKPKEAQCMILAIDDAETIKDICDEVLDFDPHIPIIAKVDSREVQASLDAIDVINFNSRTEIAKLLVQKAVEF
ncbi:cation:proton antiporter [Helicobacter canis]|uniref:cation:proton antiporter n=1 Tax=Helicobacter canis TaxID=29419 RepID=UPI002943BC74|nr:cation:proton antiporter [Helicobacter canis]